MKNINFNKEEKDAIIYVMKFRVESITSDPNWSGYPKNWKNEHYQSLRTSKWKIEDNKTTFLNSELINMESCLNEYAPTENYLHATGLKPSRIKNPYLSALKNIKN